MSWRESRVIDGQKNAVLSFKNNGTFSVISNQKTFSDIKTHWARQDIDSLAAKMVITGVSYNTFAPEKQVTRAQFVTMLVRALGGELPVEKAGFKDLQADAWYAGTVYTALKLGIVLGDTWARQSVAFCLKNGILQGDARKGLAPAASYTRAQAAVLIMKMLAGAELI